MNNYKDKAVMDAAPRNPFWVCFAVFLLLAGDYGFRLYSQLDQRAQLGRARIMQEQNAGTLAQARQLEARLEALSLDLLQLAPTNAAAQKIVQDFNIQWNPQAAASQPAAPGPGQAPPPAAKKK